MKKSTIKGLIKGSAAHVVTHGKWQRSRGRRFSMAFGLEANPERAFILAERVLRNCANFQTLKVSINYTGEFVLELTAEANMDVAKEVGAVIIGQEVHAAGYVHQSLSGIQLHNGPLPFYYSYYFLKAIRKPDGEYLWKNNSYDRML